MVIGIGTDIVSVDRIRTLSPAAVERVLTPEEAEYCRRQQDPAERIAGRFAAKEAVLKALGTGWAQGLGWQQLKILPNEYGAPVVTLTGAAERRLREIGATHCLVSISHESAFAVAFAMALDGNQIDPSMTPTSA
jgi:holo-[acyl-carrier protein] synthase